MPVFVEDPTLLSISRLKSDLIAHNVALPPAKSKKEVYVELHLKHVDQKHAGDFSSDEEGDPVLEEEEEEEEDEEDDEVAENGTMPDPSALTDDDLKAALLERGVKAGPVVASTRSVYEKKLRKLLEPERREMVNGAGNAALYSDSEEDEEEEEADEEGSKRATPESLEQSEPASLPGRQVALQKGAHVYPQCFLLSSRLRPCAFRQTDSRPGRNSRNVLKSSKHSGPAGQIPTGISRASSADRRSGLGSGVPPRSPLATPPIGSPLSFSITEMVEEMESRRSRSASADSELSGCDAPGRRSRSSRPETPAVCKSSVAKQSPYYTPKAFPYEWGKKPQQDPADDAFKDLLPDVKTTPTGIYATRRRPIKGAAGRPVQYLYPDTPLSPTTLERREVERRVLPVKMQIVVFVALALILYLIYACVDDDDSPCLAVLDSVGQWAHGVGELLLPDETQDKPALSGQE